MVEYTTRLWSYSAGWNLSASGICHKTPRVSVFASSEIQMWNSYLPGLPWCIGVDSVPGVCAVVINIHCHKCFISLTKKKKHGPLGGCLHEGQTKHNKVFFCFLLFLQCLQSVSGSLRWMWQTQHLPVTWSKYQCFLQTKTVWSECWTMRSTHPTCLYTGYTCFMTSPKFLFSGFLSNPAANIRLKSFSKNGGSGPVGSSDTLSWKLGWENIIATDNVS